MRRKLRWLLCLGLALILDAQFVGGIEPEDDVIAAAHAELGTEFGGQTDDIVVAIKAHRTCVPLDSLHKGRLGAGGIYSLCPYGNRADFSQALNSCSRSPWPVKTHTGFRRLKMEETSPPSTLGPTPGFIVDVETTGLDPLAADARLTVIGALASPDESWLFCDDNEATMLRQFFTLLAQRQPRRLYGFNIAFDLRWLLVRSLKHHLRPPFDVRDRAVDLQRILACGQFGAKGTLADYAACLGLGAKREANGSVAITLWQQQDVARLLDYCYGDLCLTYTLAHRMAHSGLL